jgi:hypothetical protein
LEGQALVITTTTGIKTLDGIKTGIIRMEIPFFGNIGTASYFDGSYLSLSPHPCNQPWPYNMILQDMQ